MRRPQPGGDVEVIACAAHRMGYTAHIPDDPADVLVNALPMRRREPRFSVFRTEHDVIVQREVRGWHVGEFQIGWKHATMNFRHRVGKGTVPEAQKKPRIANSRPVSSCRRHARN